MEMMRELMARGILLLVLALVLLVLLACVLYLAFGIGSDIGDFYDYVNYREDFWTWKWEQERKMQDPPEVREQRILAELKEVRKEMERRDRKRGTARICTVFIPGRILKHYF